MADIEQIIRDWRDEFPLLKSFSSRTLFMRVDMVLLGLWIGKLRSYDDYYLITLEILPLWNEYSNGDIISCFFCNARDRKGYPISVDLNKHQRQFGVAVRDVKESFGSVLREEIRVSDLYQLIYSKYYYDKYAVSPNPLELSRLFELQLAIALYFDNGELMASTKESIEREIRKLNINRFNEFFKMPVQQWLDELYAKFSNRERFIEIIQQNCARKKVSKLNQAHFICDLPVNTAGNGFFSRLLRHLGF